MGVVSAPHDQRGNSDAGEFSGDGFACHFAVGAEEPLGGAIVCCELDCEILTCYFIGYK